MPFPMWSSSSGEDQNENNTINNNGLNRGSLSSSSPSPFSPLTFNPRAKTMEEVWKDINPSSLHHGRPSRCLTFQDFLARPFSIDPSNSAVSSRFASPAPPPGTMLTLNSVPELQCFGNSGCEGVNAPTSKVLGWNPKMLNINPLRHNPILQHQTVKQVCQKHSLQFDSNEKKRLPEIEYSVVDRRNKRMIKNRESAARSRARKQAYTNELELEVAQLTEENARLKEQQEQLYMAASAQLPDKHKLCRTTTAPF